MDAVESSNASGYHHVAIIVQLNPITIVEASSDRGVIETILTAEEDIVVDFRSVDLNADVKNLAAHLAKSIVGSGYNHLFYPYSINSYTPTFYCSQLVQYVYNVAFGEEVFPSIQMNFSNDEGKVIEYWEKYYDQFDSYIPQGELGTHPGQILSSDHLVPIC